MSNFVDTAFFLNDGFIGKVELYATGVLLFETLSIILVNVFALV